MTADPRIRHLKTLLKAGTTWAYFVAWWVQIIHNEDYFTADDHWVKHVEDARWSPELAVFGGIERVQQAEYVAQKNTGFVEATGRRCQFCFLEELRLNPLIRKVLGDGVTPPEIPEHWVHRQGPDAADRPAAGLTPSIQAIALSWARIFLVGTDESRTVHEAWATNQVFAALMLPRPMSFPEINELVERVRSGPDDYFYNGEPVGESPVPVH